MLRLIVLGRYGPYPSAGGGCSGYLLEHEGHYVLLECGNGILSRLQHHLDPSRLQAAVLSHLHSDHVSDIFILRYNLLFSMEQGLRKDPLPLYAPSQPAMEFERLPYKGVYQTRSMQPRDPAQIGPFRLAFHRAQHSVSCFGISVEIEGRKLLAFSGDTEYCGMLEELAADSPLFLCEASYLEEDIKRGAGNHMSAKQAALAAKRAGAGRLLLTHLHPAKDEARLLGEARASFPGAELAVEGKEYMIEK